MKLERTGIILFVEKFKECVSFYRDIIGLKILFQNEDLTCFDFGGSYLMIEPRDNEYPDKKRKNDKNGIRLRFNVSDIKSHSEKLKSLGIHVNIEEYDWGTVAKFKDPDGNNCSLKDSEKFELQIKNFKG